MVWPGAAHLTVILHSLQEVIKEMDTGSVTLSGERRDNPTGYKGVCVGMFHMSFIKHWKRLHKQVVEYLSSGLF